MDRLACLEVCSDNVCSYQCDIDFASCVNSCPCKNDRRIGCADCSSLFSKCNDPENSPEYLECKEMVVTNKVVCQPYLSLWELFRELQRRDNPETLHDCIIKFVE